MAIYLPMFVIMRDLEKLAGTPIPDVTPLHNAADLSAMFASLGTSDGLADYARFGRYDLLLPLFVAALLGSLIFTVWRSSPRRNLAWVPVASLDIADYGENFIVHRLASRSRRVSMSRWRPSPGS